MKFINKYLGIIITIIVIINGVYIFNVIKNKKEVELDEVILKEEKIDKKETFAIMLQNDNGEYISSNSRVFPTEGYRYNETKSGCMDVNGYKIDNSLSYNNETNKVVVRINKEAHCYVYFDKLYTVTYDLDGGTFDTPFDVTPPVKVVAYGDNYGELPEPTKTGYSFLGWSTTDNILPNNYQEVEYIESTGTQYIDTGYKGENSLYKAIVDFRLLDALPLSTNKAIFGTHVTADPYYYNTFSFLGSYISQKFFYKFSGSGHYSKKDLDNNRHFLEFYHSNNSVNVVLDSKEIRSDNNNYGQGNYSMQYNVYLFAENREGTASLLSQMQLYSFKLYENNSLVRNFVPCYNKETSVIGLYDTVTKLFYTNAGSGTFIKGQDHEYTQSSSRVNIYRNHTLKAIWEANS